MRCRSKIGTIKCLPMLCATFSSVELLAPLSEILRDAGKDRCISAPFAHLGRRFVPLFWLKRAAHQGDWK